MFGTDASGGPFSSDPRLRVVSWAVVYGRVKEGQFCFEGQASGRLPQGATVTQGEAAAMAFVLKETTKEATVIADSKASIAQAESHKFTAAMHPIWNEVFEDRGRLRLEWIKSHQLEEDFIRDHGLKHRWKWQVNSMADKLCGKRSAEVAVSAHAKKVQAVDKIAFEVNHFLCDRVKALLMSEVTPALSLLKAAKERKSRGDFRGKQHRPAADGGLNKKERMQRMIDQQQGGHDYEWTRKTSVNWAITCKKCKLYQEQVHALEKFSRIEKQTCAHQVMPWPERWVLGKGHDMYNLGVVWICKRCWAIVRPSSDDLAGRLKATCNGKHYKRSKQYGLLLPNEGLVSNQRKTISQLQPSSVPEACKSQQSKLRNFFDSSPGAPSQSSSSAVGSKAPQEAKVQPSPQSKRHRTLVAEEVVSSPPESSHGQAGQVGQGQSKSPQQAQAKSRSRSSVPRASQLEVCQGATESVQVNAQQKQAKAGSPKKKAAMAAKASRKGSCARSQSAPSTASAAVGASKQEQASKAKKEPADEDQQISEEEEKEADQEVVPEQAVAAASLSAPPAREPPKEEEMVPILSSDDESEAEALDPLEPWQRRMVAKKMTQCKDEVVAHPHMMDLGYHLVVPAIPNRRKPIKEHHWLARKALLCRVPWGLSAGIAGPLTLPADLGYVGQGRNRFCYMVPN